MIVDASLLRAGVLALLALSVGAVFSVMRLHWRAYTRLPREAGLTPLHVSLVSLGTLVMQGTLASALIASFGSGADTATTVRTALYGVSTLIILAALGVIARLQRRRIRFGRERKTVTVHADDTVQVDTDDPHDR